MGVAMDDNGLIPEDLERKIRQCHPKMIYVIPTFQNPSGRTLSLERRKAVAELAAKYDVLVLEDEPFLLPVCLINRKGRKLSMRERLFQHLTIDSYKG